MVQNKGFMFKRPVTGWPIPGVDIAIESRPFALSQAPPGGLLTKNLYASFDPYMRGRMRDPEIRSYTPAYTIGQPITSYIIAQVLASDCKAYKQGDIIFALLNLEEYSAVPKELVENSVTRKIDNSHNFPLSTFISVLGQTGLTAYASLYEIGAPKKGETIFISSAAGAVGQVVGQLAKHEGLRVIGSVGDDNKLAYITEELGFDGGFNYKKEKTAEALKRLAPNGIDIYFENVGGEQLEAALDAMNDFGRIVACGMVSQYNLKPGQAYCIRNLIHIVSKRLKMQGFIARDENMGPKYFKERNERVSAWLADGSFKSKESITEGMDNAIEGFIGMLKGENFGKAILKLGDPEA